jgi:FKBP-type peptidyl-prolyl cis-trans isomerase
LKVHLGNSQIGDVCQIHIVGNITSTTKPSGLCSCIAPSTQYIDTNQTTKRVTVKIKENANNDIEGLYRGLNEGLKTMVFGEESTFYVPSELAFGSEGLSMANEGDNNPDHVNRNPGGISFLKIGPDEDLLVDIVFFRVCRDGVLHNRTIKNSASVFNSGYASHM